VLTRYSGEKRHGSPLAHELAMNWIVWLSLAVIVTAVAAVTGIKPRGTRPVAHSRLMGVGRVVLLIMVVIFAVLAFRARSG
jgi:hypothetical protein